LLRGTGLIVVLPGGVGVLGLRGLILGLIWVVLLHYESSFFYLVPS
jgi:hypothetical protein